MIGFAKSNFRARLNWFVLLALLPAGGFASAQSVPGIKVPAGFEVIQAAADDLATNIYCLAVGPNGKTYVSGPGYIKVLSDTNQDGVFDSVHLFSDRPKSGAQGICFDGNDLLCTGDGGLWRFADSDANSVADAAPEKVLPIKTGGEHDAHAIRKGPDGWWYLLAGNGVPISPEYFAGEHSPVKDPRAGFLMRISPDWQEKEIFAHGFRNAYDFDFNAVGKVFVYDSDGERDISLPWYRPTRIYEMRAGDDAGWVAAGWKRPSYFFDMPIEVGALGRGSPTGVVVGKTNAFPSSYNDAIFVADWTFGRVVAFRHRADSSGYDRGTDFAMANGQFGFAVTDLDFAHDGSLLISAGGRGTQGAIYRVRFVGKPDDGAEAEETPPFVTLAKSKRLPEEQLINALHENNLSVQLAALEALVGRRDILGGSTHREAELNQRWVEGLTNLLRTSDSKTLGLLMRVVKELDAETLQSIDMERLPTISQLMITMQTQTDARDRTALIREVVKVLASGQSDPLIVARIGQLTLGGCGQEKSDQMFIGYSAHSPLDIVNDDRHAIADQLAIAMISSQAQSDRGAQNQRTAEEIGRLAAMLGCGSDDLHEQIVGLLERESSTAQQDIHWLNCLSQVIDDSSCRLDERLEPKVASVLVGIMAKIKRDEQNIDRNFFPRMRSLTRRLCQRIGIEFSLMVATKLRGDDDDVFLFESLNGMAKDAAVPRFVASIESQPEQATAGQLNAIAAHSGGIYLPLVRRFAGRKELEDVVIASLVGSPSDEDKKIFVAGLNSAKLKTLKNSAIGLRRIGKKLGGSELVAVYKTVSQLAWDKPSVSVRDQLMLLLQNQTGKEFGYQASKKDLVQDNVVDRWGDFVKANYPSEFARALDDGAERSLTDRLAEIDWESGDKVRGKGLYRTLQCAQCHDAGSRMGPRLEGITKRFSRDDLFRSIVVPNNQVPERYRAINIETVDGQFYQGSMVYESVDGITLQEVGGNTVRINQSDIESRSVSRRSLMPEGLLKDATDRDWADLFAYLSQ